MASPTKATLLTTVWQLPAANLLPTGMDLGTQWGIFNKLAETVAPWNSAWLYHQSGPMTETSSFRIISTTTQSHHRKGRTDLWIKWGWGPEVTCQKSSDLRCCWAWWEAWGASLQGVAAVVTAGQASGKPPAQVLLSCGHLMGGGWGQMSLCSGTLGVTDFMLQLFTKEQGIFHFIFYGAGQWAWGLMRARQVPHHWATYSALDFIWMCVWMIKDE